MAKKEEKKGMGCGPMAAVMIVLLAILIFGGNEAMGIYLSECEEDENFMECMMGIMAEDEEEEAAEGSVVATGSYTWKDYTVNITMNIPLKGGNVTGSVSGACDGSVKGSYNGQEGGAISGKLSGSCDPFFVKIPASADYSGSVNKGGKTVPIQFTGRGGGLTHQGSMTLTYP